MNDFNELPMSKKQAIKSMCNGEKVTHRHFAPDEWMKKSNFGYEFEDGCLCSEKDFWRLRKDDSWLEGWKVFL